MIKLKTYIKNLKTFNWSLWIALCALALIPAVYTTIRTFLISTNVSADGIDVIGQMEWFDLIDETIKAFLIIPLYSILNRIFKVDEENFKYHVFKTMIITFAVYFIFSLIVFFTGLYMVEFMNPNEVDIAEVYRYLRLETIAFAIGIIPSFVNVVFVTVGKAKNVYIFMGVKVVLSIIADFLLVPAMGVNGIAVSNIITNSILAIVGCLVLFLEGYLKAGWFKKNDKNVALSWLKVGVFSGIQQFIDNIFYALMIARMVNMVAEQGNYWVANNFIWGLMLIPVTAMTEIIRRDCKNGYGELKQSNYYLLSLFIFIFWAVTIPLWTPYFQHVEQLENYQEIFLIVLKLSPFYIAYGLSVIPDNIFIGLGKTKYNAINSAIVNGIYYGIWFILYLTEAITFSMDTIIMMFGFGMVFHLVVSIAEEKIFLRHELKKVTNLESERNV